MVDSQVSTLSPIKSPKIFNQPPIVSYRKEKSLKDILVVENFLQSRRNHKNMP